MKDASAIPAHDLVHKRFSDLNAFLSKGALRRYQDILLGEGRFTCPHPATGVQSILAGNYVIPGTAIFYYFAAEKPFVLVAASLKDGFPLLAAVTRNGVVWADKQERRDLIPFAQSLLATPVPSPLQPNARSRAIIGDANFAHFLWNEFPAFHATLKRHGNFDLDRRFDPFDLISTCAGKHGLPVQDLMTPGENSGWSIAPTTFLGATKCSSSDKAALMTHLKLPAYTPSAERIWLTVRDQGRTMENQVSFLSAFITAQCDRNPDTQFLIDGFSTPMDLERPIYNALRPKFMERIAQAKSSVRTIANANPAAQIHDLTGQSLLAALRAIGTCGFYVSHTGTMQHKAGWLYPLPGVQHGNSASLTPAALRWPARMVEGALDPFGLEPSIIKDTAVRGLPVQNDRNKDYIVTDIPASVRLVLAQMDATLSMTSEG